MATKCDFSEKDNMIHDKIVFSTRSVSLKERLLREKDLSLTRAIDLCKAAEITQREMKAMCTQPGLSENSRSVNIVQRTKPHSKHSHSQYRKPTPGGASKSVVGKPCMRCGRHHGPNTATDCPAFGRTCRKCNGPNHFAVCCENSSKKKGKQVHELGAEFSPPSGSETDEFFIGTIQVGSLRDCVWFEPISVCGSKIKMKIDTGAEANSIPLRTWEKIVKRPSLSNSNIVLRSFGGSIVSHAGVASVQLAVGSTTAAAEVFVTHGDTVPILGLKSCTELGLVQPGDNASVGLHHAQVSVVTCEGDPITMETLEEEYTIAFTGEGNYPEEYHITLVDHPQCTIDAPRRVAHCLKVPLKAKLDELVSKGVIAKQDGPTDWVHSLVIAQKKDGSLRLCLDPKSLNACIRREHFQIPTFEDISAELSGKKLFSILDQKDSYWQICLDHDSSLLCTFNTPFGRYRFLKMPFGISSAAEVQQKKTYQVFGDIEGVHIIADDMLIAAADEQEHDRIMRKVLERAIQYGVKFNFHKVQLKKTSIVYMGVVISSEGLKPDSAKVKAIVDMPDPQDKEGVKRLIGMLNFLSPFIPDKYSMIAPLRSLLKEDVPWHWDHEQEAAMGRVREILSSNPVLQLYDPSQPVTIQADASSTGLRACLMQNSRPVAYASRSLSECETRYAQIEKELLAIVFAVTKFHHFIYGTQVEVESDHKPLEAILRKPLHKATPRIQLMLLKLMRYKLEIKYVPGSRMYIADTLSRAYVPGEEDDSMDMALGHGEYRIHSVTTGLPISQEKLSEMRQATQQDKTLTKLRQYTSHGWPSHRAAAPPELHPYWQIRDEIHEEDGLMFLGERLIIPTEVRAEMLSRLHEGHAGMEKSKSRAAEVMFWPNMSKDIESHVSNSPICATYARSKQREPLLPHDVPSRPWSKLGADLFHYAGHSYLVLVDYFSKYLEIHRLSSKTAQSVVSALKSMFARHGIPDTLMSDNMPFSSVAFQQFARDLGFELSTSSPTYAQSNGESERYVQSVKNMMRKAMQDGLEPHIALLQYRNTPVSGLKYSPAQLLMSRRLKDKLPSTSVLLAPQVVTNAEDDLRLPPQRQKHYYDRGTKPQPPFGPGDHVRVRLNKTWDHPIVTGKHPAPRSYYVTTENGPEYRRNSSSINPSPDLHTWFQPCHPVVQVLFPPHTPYPPCPQREWPQAIPSPWVTSSHLQPPDKVNEPRLNLNGMMIMLSNLK